MMNLNTAAVAGNINVGAGYSQLETVTEVLDISTGGTICEASCKFLFVYYGAFRFKFEHLNQLR